MAKVRCNYWYRCRSKDHCPHAKPHKWTNRCDAGIHGCGHNEVCKDIPKNRSGYSHYGINLSFDVPHNWKAKDIDKCIRTLVKEIKQHFYSWKSDFSGMGVNNVIRRFEPDQPDSDTETTRRSDERAGVVQFEWVQKP